MSSNDKSYARVKLENRISNRVMVQFYHRNSHYKSFDSATWVIETGTTNHGSLKAYFEPGNPATDDWFLVVHVPEDADDGIKAGTYISNATGGKGSIAKPSYSQCQLGPADVYDPNDGTDLKFYVNVVNSTLQFEMATSVQTVTSTMRKFRDYQQIQHVFVLMP